MSAADRIAGDGNAAGIGAELLRMLGGPFEGGVDLVHLDRVFRL